MVVGSTVLSTPANEEDRRVIRVPLPYTPSSGVATSLSMSVLVTRDKEEDDRRYVKSGGPGIGRERRDSTGLWRPTAVKIAAV